MFPSRFPPNYRISRAELTTSPSGDNFRIYHIYPESKGKKRKPATGHRHTWPLTRTRWRRIYIQIYITNANHTHLCLYKMLIYGQNRSINLNVKINATGGARATPRIRRSELTGLQARLKQSPGGVSPALGDSICHHWVSFD